jgi:hypothetical protein
VEFAKMLISRANVAVSPGLGFGNGGEGFVRFALVENVQRIKQATRGIKKALSLPAGSARAPRPRRAKAAATAPPKGSGAKDAASAEAEGARDEEAPKAAGSR